VALPKSSFRVIVAVQCGHIPDKYGGWSATDSRRYADGESRGVRPPGSSPRLEPSSADRSHPGWVGGAVAAWLPMASDNLGPGGASPFFSADNGARSVELQPSTETKKPWTELYCWTDCNAGERGVRASSGGPIPNMGHTLIFIGLLSLFSGHASSNLRTWQVCFRRRRASEKPSLKNKNTAAKRLSL